VKLPLKPEALRAAGLHLAIALVATFPLVTRPLSRLVGHPDVDLWNHAWGAWWFWDCFSQGRLPYHTDLLMAPQGGPLWYIDPVGALLTAPLVPLLGVALSWNLLVLGNVLLASWAVRRLALVLGASAAASWLASVALACSPYLLSEVHNGVSEAMGIGWCLLALTAGLQAMKSDRLRDWAVTGLLLGITGVASYYYGLAAGLLLACWALLLPGPPWLRRGAGGLLALAVASLLLLPAGALIQHSLLHPQAIAARTALPQVGREMLMAHNAVDPRSFLWPGDFQSVDLAAMGEAFRHSSYLGLAALALALSARRWRLLAGGLVLGVLSLGPWLWWDGDWFTLSSGARLALPTKLLGLALPSVATTHFQRLGMPLVALVAALAALAASRWPRRWLVTVALVLAADGLLLGPSPWPLRQAAVPDWRAHEAIAASAPETEHDRLVNTVLDLPVEVGATMAVSRYLLYQAASHRPIPNRPDPRFDSSSLLGVPAYSVLAAASVTREPHRSGLLGGMGGQLEQVEILDLRTRGIQWIVLHTELVQADEADHLRAQLELWFGSPEIFGPHLLFATSGARSSKGRVLPLREVGEDATLRGPG